MYKKTQQSHHYLPRIGSFSTHPARNGRVDVLPPEATEPLYDAVDQITHAEDRLRALAIERDTVTDRLLIARGVQRLGERHGSAKVDPSELNNRLQNIDAEIGQLKRHITDLRALLRGSGIATFPEAFAKIAAVELSKDTYEKLAAKAHQLVEVARATRKR